MKKLLPIVIAMAFLASCASNPTSNNRIKNLEVSHNAKIALADKNSDEKVLCQQIKKTGSHRVTTICRSTSEIDKTRQNTQREMQKRAMRGSPKKVGS